MTCVFDSAGFGVTLCSGPAGRLRHRCWTGLQLAHYRLSGLLCNVKQEKTEQVFARARCGSLSLSLCLPVHISRLNVFFYNRALINASLTAYHDSKIPLVVPFSRSSLHISASMYVEKPLNWALVTLVTARTKSKTKKIHLFCIQLKLVCAE